MHDFLHLPTIMIIMSMTTLLSCLVACTMWFADQENKILASLAACLSAATLSSACIAARPFVPYTVGVTACNALAILSAGLFWTAVQHFEKQKPSYPLVAFAVFVTALTSEISAAEEWPQARILVTGLFFSLFFILSGAAVFTGETAEPMPVRKLAGSIFLTQAVLWLAQVPFIAMAWDIQWDGLHFPQSFKVLFLLTTVLVPFLPLALLLLTRQRYEIRLRRASETDTLTRINNRRVFLERAETLLEEEDTPAALILFDIDHFKSINDHHGHAAGDAVLVSVAETLKNNSADDWTPVRLGGEEFACLLPNISQKDAQHIAETFRKTFEKMETPHNGINVRCTVSIGVAATGGDIQSIDQLLAAADTRMYFAKHNGRNRVCAEETPELLQHIAERMHGFNEKQSLGATA